MTKITTQFYDNHRPTTHEERKNGIAIVETTRERIRYYCFACLVGTGFPNGDVQVRDSAGLVPGIFPSHSRNP